jgi:hypothetical protein
MKVLESDVGQQAKEFADALFRNFMPDGTNCLEALHRNGLMKKIPSNQVLVTPTPTSSVRLDELNGILKEMSKGEEAVKRLAEIDASQGMTGKAKKREAVREVGVPPTSRTKEVVANEVTAKEVSTFLSDTDLAKDRVRQASNMKSQAESLLKEVQRLLTEAAELDPSLKQDAKSTTTKKKAKVQVKEN